MAKTFLQIFDRYEPSEKDAALLLTAQNIKISADKESRMLQARCIE